MGGLALSRIETGGHLSANHHESANTVTPKPTIHHVKSSVGNVLLQLAPSNQQISATFQKSPWPQVTAIFSIQEARQLHAALQVMLKQAGV